MAHRLTMMTRAGRRVGGRDAAAAARCEPDRRHGRTANGGPAGTVLFWAATCLHIDLSLAARRPSVVKPQGQRPNEED
jgi:hypothetical protein